MYKYLCVAAMLLIVCTTGCHKAIRMSTPPPPMTAKWHGLHIINHTSDEDLALVEEYLPDLAHMGINTLILEINYGFRFRSHPELRADSSVITSDGAKRFAAACRSYGIRLIPQFQCLGHQSWAGTTFPLLTKYPEFDLTPGAYEGNEGIYCREWDPTNPEVNRIVFSLMDELIDAFDSKYFHVGMDEVFLLGDSLSPSTFGKDPAHLFAKAVNEYHDHLIKDRRVEMLMWGDRLIDADKYPYGSWEASETGSAGAIDMIPTDIIICDWHYEVREMYPSIPLFLDKGFRILPSGWRDAAATEALITYSFSFEDPGMLGHLFTTWSRKMDQIIEFPSLIAGLEKLYHVETALLNQADRP
jgi:hypothetical protein